MNELSILYPRGVTKQDDGSYEVVVSQIIGDRIDKNRETKLTIPAGSKDLTRDLDVILAVAKKFLG